MLASAVVGAQFVATTSARDALFLTGFSAKALPAMMIGSSAISIVLVALASRGLRRVAPSTYVPLIFAMSALLILVEWSLARIAPGPIARIFYLHATGLGPMLGSGLWLVMSERFDPRTARKRFGQIGGLQTLGGVVGGLLAAPVAARAGVRDMLLLAAVLQAVCAWLVHGLAGPIGPAVPPRARLPQAEVPSTWRVLTEAPYLRTLAVLMLVVTIAAAFIDYVFKVQVTANINRGTDLGTFFSLYYAALNVLTFAIQAFGSHAFIERLGLAAAAGAPSLLLAAGSVLAIVMPGLWSVIAAHGGERVSHGSLFRTGYEQFYTPVAPGDRRAVKAAIDVGVGRTGDMIGAAVVLILQGATGGSPVILLLACAIGCSLVALVAARSLTRGYVTTLEKSLLHRAVEIDLSDVEDLTTRTTVLRTIPRHAPAPAPPLSKADSGTREIAALQSRNPEAVRRVLADPKGVPGALVPHVIALLAWDAVAHDAIRALRGVAEERVGQLVDALVDPNQPFAVRRRLARVFSVCVSQRAADGVALGLDDLRFEVRFHCGRSLAAIVEKNPRVRIDREAILEAVRREVNVGRSVWEGRQLLDALPAGDEEQSPAEQVVSERASQSLAHVFTLLSLVLPTEAIRVAYNALHHGDERARGTALEYLDAVLPPDIKERLWPFLEMRRRASTQPPRRRDEILADLLRENESIVLNLRTRDSTADVQGRPASNPRRSS